MIDSLHLYFGYITFINLYETHYVAFFVICIVLYNALQFLICNIFFTFAE